MRRRVDAEHAQEILAEHRGDAAERGGANQHDLRPAVEERIRPAPSFAQVDIHAAGLGHRRRQLGERQRAAQDHQAADDPAPKASTSDPARASAMPAGVRKIPPPMVMPMTMPIELQSPRRRTRVGMAAEVYL